MIGKFYFDGIDSSVLGIYIVGINNTDDTMPLFGSQSFVSQDVMGYDYSTFIRTKKENLKFTLYFTLCDESLTPDRLNGIGKFFARSIPFEFMVEEDKTKVIKIVPTSGIEIVRLGEMKGYFQVTFQATTPYWMSPMEQLTFNLSANDSFNLENGRNIQDKYGRYDIYPKIIIHNTGATVSNFILNNTSTGTQVTFDDLVANDTVTMHNKILTSELDPNIFQKWNRNPFYLTNGTNMLTINTNCVINIYMQYPIF